MAHPKILLVLCHPQLIDGTSYELPLQFKIPLTLDLADSLVYLLESALNDISNQNLYLNEHRVMEIVLLLLNSEGRGQLLKIIRPDLPICVANILCKDLSQPWTTAKLAAELNISVSTLKRQLKKHQTSCRQILTAARMEKAMKLIQQDEYAIAKLSLIISGSIKIAFIFCKLAITIKKVIECIYSAISAIAYTKSPN